MTVKSVPDTGRLLDKQSRLFIYVYIGYSLADVEPHLVKCQLHAMNMKLCNGVQLFDSECVLVV